MDSAVFPFQLSGKGTTYIINTGDDLTIGFTGDKHGILINHEFLRTSSKLAEAPIDCLTGFLRVVFMFLGIDA